jgi:hypothetical protein
MKIFRITAFPPIITAFYLTVKYFANDRDMIDFNTHFPNGLNFKDYMKMYDNYKPKYRSDENLMVHLVFFGNLMYVCLSLLALFLFFLFK